MINRNHIAAYKNSEVGSAGKMRLVILMYDGIIRFLGECMNKMEKGDVAGRGLYISKAQKILNELQGSLNKQVGGEVAENLERLYSFIMNNLTNANINGDTALIEQSIKVLRNLRDAWQQLMSGEQKEEAQSTPDNQRLAIQL